MNNQNDPAEHGPESNSSLTPTQVAEPVHAPATEPATAQQLQAVEKQMSGFEKATLRWAKLAVFMSAIAALFICLQWYEMHSGGQDTHDLAVAANTQAEKMKDMSDAADKIRQAAEGMVTQEQRIADNAKNALDASNRQSKASLDATISQFRYEQRAWVSAGNFLLEGFKADSTPKATVEWLNSGKTFAKKVRVNLHLRLGSEAMQSEHELAEAARKAIDNPEESIGALGPGTKATSVIKPSRKLSALEISDMSRAYTYFWAELTYYDVFKRRHQTEVCVYRRGIEGEFLQCPFHNDAD